MEYQNTDELIRKLSLQSKTEATKKLTEFYAEARFKIRPEDFIRQYTDGSDDGGIDFYYNEDNTFFIFQAKFSGSPKRVNISEIYDEIRKIKNTLTAENPNKKADDFVNLLKREAVNNDAILEILWLTTNIVKQSVREEVQNLLTEWRKENGWLIGIDFVVIDKFALESIIYDRKHGFIPYTGKRIIKLEEGQWLENTKEETGVYSIVCAANINDILKWFRNSDEIDTFLQKNVREFIGETHINKAISRSYLDAPTWFWYKHNGIIIFADNLHVDKTNMELVLRNPQVVNGGQTLKVLFSVYNRNNRNDNSAKVMLRIYRLPYEDTETYKRSIEIIAALNSQNKIYASDLRSTDPKQVRLERLFKDIGNNGSGYKYWRKRSKEAKSARYAITMRNLALRYYVCKKNVPQEGVRGEVEELFEEDAKYNEIFDENAINKELSGNHVAFNYVTCWNINRILQEEKNNFLERDREYFEYTRWFVLADVYKKLLEWKQIKFNLPWRIWIEFIESQQFADAVYKYSRSVLKIGREIIPRGEDAKSFFKTRDAVSKFNAKVSACNFKSIMNKCASSFRRENE